MGGRRQQAATSEQTAKSPGGRRRGRRRGKQHKEEEEEVVTAGRGGVKDKGNLRLRSGKMVPHTTSEDDEEDIFELTELDTQELLGRPKKVGGGGGGGGGGGCLCSCMVGCLSVNVRE
ncbi:hypothetical protein E2C01_096627 [Portunus trituberculatus]|uniref:Uncharacterized protein n=1 Tax=Portunus trituberculatus TaxID=210409 RepID=A0A5B7K3A9_PORTR|nr:hypothetical protein [Portunus trituberculatus]